MIEMINLPAGKPVERGISIKDTDLKATFDNLSGASLNGYLCLMIDGVDGLEEGVAVFKEGHPVAAAYEYLKHDQLILAEEAMTRLFNAAHAGLGVLDVYSLTKEQADLVLAFNGKAAFKKLLQKQDIDRMALGPKSFSTSYAESDVKVRGREDESK
ncbi:MAG: DUF2226 domain-containing protein, partial [Candidatus Diapherotrites archaeon]|nr:DUF2226 domain-containing protein [Candidatus Diapherotrites archaeon]